MWIVIDVWSGKSCTYCLQGSHLIVREVPMPTYEERVRLLAHHRLSELGTLGPRRRPCNCTTHTKLHSMCSWRTTLCTWSAVVEFREAPLAPGAARRASRVMDVLLLLLLLTMLAHGQCTVDKDIHIKYTSVKDIFIKIFSFIILVNWSRDIHREKCSHKRCHQHLT